MPHPIIKNREIRGTNHVITDSLRQDAPCTRRILPRTAKTMIYPGTGLVVLSAYFNGSSASPQRYGCDKCGLRLCRTTDSLPCDSDMVCPKFYNPRSCNSCCSSRCCYRFYVRPRAGGGGGEGALVLSHAVGPLVCLLLAALKTRNGSETAANQPSSLPAGQQAKNHASTRRQVLHAVSCNSCSCSTNDGLQMLGRHAGFAYSVWRMAT